MHRSVLTGQRLVAVFLLGCLLFNYPLLALTDGVEGPGGVPLAFLHVFAAWGGLIALMAWIIERRGD